MEGFLTALTAQVNAGNLWSALTAAAGLVGVAVIFSFGYRVVRRAVGGIANGKAKL